MLKKMILFHASIGSDCNRSDGTYGLICHHTSSQYIKRGHSAGKRSKNVANSKESPTDSPEKHGDGVVWSTQAEIRKVGPELARNGPFPAEPAKSLHM